MNRDKRPRRQDGLLFRSCIKCRVEPDRRKRFYIFQKLEEKEKQEGNDVTHRFKR